MSRLVLEMPQQLKEAIRASAKAQGTTMTNVAMAAIEDYLNPDEYKVASLRHLSNLVRKLDVLLARDEATLETIGRFILIYLMHTPPLPDSEARAASQEARLRWDSFVDKIAQSLSQNNTYLSAIADASPLPESFYYSHLKKNDES